jgi:hypothetical protein
LGFELDRQTSGALVAVDGAKVEMANEKELARVWETGGVEGVFKQALASPQQILAGSLEMDLMNVAGGGWHGGIA